VTGGVEVATDDDLRAEADLGRTHEDRGPDPWVSGCERLHGSSPGLAAVTSTSPPQIFSVLKAVLVTVDEDAKSCISIHPHNM
jgi:hypothetical protein